MIPSEVLNNKMMQCEEDRGQHEDHDLVRGRNKGGKSIRPNNVYIS